MLLLGNPHRLPSGLRVRVRLPHASDRLALPELLGRLGLAADELEVRRALRFEPRGTTVCATALVDGRERLVGLAAEGLLLADEACAPGVGALLRAAVLERSLAA